MTVQIVGWTLIHSLWQGALIAALLGVVLVALRKAPAAWRHTACLIALVAMPLMPLLTSIQTVDRSTTTQIAPTSTADFGPAPTSSPATQSLDVEGPAAGAPANGNQSARPRVDVEALFPWLVRLWLLGVLLLSLRVIGGFVGARRLVTYGTSAVPDEIAQAAQRIAQRIRVSQTVRVLASVRAPVPMVIGLVRPVVLMPVSLLTGLTLSQVEAILAHELAHVRRYDYAINLLQTVIETLFFYHPAAWWVSRKLRDEREQACDELAVSMCGDDPIFYSRVLLTVEEWRGERISFAPAATGGSLALRIRKLIGEDDRRLDVGPRWFAGVLTVAAVLLAGSSVINDKADAQTPVTEQQFPKGDTTRARPSSIDRFTGSGDMAARWAWANETARRKNFDKYWVGYVVAGSRDDTNWFYLDRNLPVQMGDSWFQGHMRFNGEFNNLRFSGLGLRSLLGDYAPQQHAVFLGFDGTLRGPRLIRVHLANYVFPMHFDRMPLLWLDEVQDAESIRMIASLENQAATVEIRGDVASAIGAHRDSRVAVPILLRWVNDASAPQDFRIEAIEALAYHGTPEVLAEIARLARGREAEDLRAEAVEALEQLAIAGAADTLRNLARTLDTERLRDEAIEALGQRPEPEVATWLEEMARAPGSEGRSKAVEALAELPEKRGLAAVTKIALDTQLDLDVRMEAVESIAEVGEGDQPLEVLSRIIFQDRDVSVQIKATETVSELDHLGAVALLERVAHTHPQVQVQVEAAEALGDAHSHNTAIAALEKLARTHPQMTVRISAIEALGNFGDEVSRVVEIFKSLLSSDMPTGAKLEVLETLGELRGKAAEALLETYVRSSDRQLRLKAVEVLAER